MLYTRHDLSLCGVVGAQPVGDHHTRRPALTLYELSHQALCRLGVAAALHQNIKNETVLIDGAPQPVFPATDRNDDLVQIPFVTEPAGRATADVVGEGPTRLLCHSRTVCCETMMPRAASMASTIRRLTGKRKESHTAWAMISAGKRWQR